MGSRAYSVILLTYSAQIDLSDNWLSPGPEAASPRCRLLLLDAGQSFASESKFEIAVGQKLYEVPINGVVDHRQRRSIVSVVWVRVPRGLDNGYQGTSLVDAADKLLWGVHHGVRPVVHREQA